MLMECYGMTGKISKDMVKVAVIIFAGKLLSLTANRYYISEFGINNEELNIFSYGLQIQNNVIQSLACAVSSIVLPCYLKIDKKEGHESAKRFADEMITFSAVAAFALMGFVGILSFVLPSFTGFTQKVLCRKAILLFLPQMFISAVLIVYQGIAQALGAVWQSVLINLIGGVTVVLYTTVFSTRFGIYGLIFAFLLSSIVQLIMLVVISKKKGYSYKFTLNFKKSGVMGYIKKMLPSAVGAGVYQLNVFLCSTAVAVFFPLSVSVYTFVQNIVFGIATALAATVNTVTYPEISRYAANEEYKEAEKLIKNSVKQISLLGIPLVLLSFFFSQNIFEALSITNSIVSEERYILRGLCPCILLLVIKEITEKASYALGDTKAFAVSSIVILAVSLLYGLLFFSTGVGAVSTAFSAGVFAGVAFLILKIKNKLWRAIKNKDIIFD